MTEIKKPDVQSYHPTMGGDPLNVEKGWCHFPHEGTRDFLDYITAYDAREDGISFEVCTFRGAKALVEITLSVRQPSGSGCCPIWASLWIPQRRQLLSYRNQKPGLL